jgi:hypothetical protein
MNEVAPKRLPDAARPIFKLHPQAGAVVSRPASNRPPPAANDEQPAWHLVPFPDGWYATC